MAEEFKIVLGIDFKDEELDNIRNQINNLQTNPINLTINTRGIQIQLDNIRKQILSLNNLRLNLGGINGNGGIQRTINETTKAYNDLMNLQRRISSIRIQISGLDSSKNTQQISELSGQLNRLMTDYNNLYQTFNRNFSTDQIDNLSHAFEVTSDKISATNAKMSDTASLKQTETAYKELYNTAKQISNLELKIGGLEKIGGSNNQITELTNQLNVLKDTYNQLMISFTSNLNNPNLTIGQLSTLNQVFTDTQNKLSLLDAKVADTKANLANEITVKLNTNEFTNDLSVLQTNFDKLRTKGTEVTTNLEQVKVALSNMKTASSKGDIDGLIGSYEKYKNTLKDVSNQISINLKAEKESVNTEKLVAQKRNMSLQMDVWLKNNSAATTEFGTRIKQLQAELQACDATKLSGIKSEFQAITREAELAGKAGQTFNDKLKTKLSELGIYFSATTLITQAISSMDSMYDNVVQVDTAMTELYRVTDLTSSQYSTMYDNMVNSAKEYGSTLDSIINSSASWVRLGFNPSDSNRLAEITSMYQHVTDLDENTAVENLVTAYKGYEQQLLELNNGDATAAVEMVADIYDKLGNEFAESAADVGNGLSKSASVLQQGGASIQEAAGMFTGIQEVLQDSGTSGTALKILTLRIRGMKGELEELGEDVDENVDSVSKIQTQILNLTHGKVNIFDNDNNFRNIYDIMDDISEIYYDLSDTDRASLLEIIAGKNRANAIQALISNWSQVESATEAAYNSAGTAAAEQDIYMQSLEGHLNQLTSAWQALSNTVLDSNFLAGGLEVITDFINLLDFAIDKVGVFPTLIGGISAGMSLKNVGIFKIIEDEAEESGLKITSIFQEAFSTIKTNNTFSYDTEFNNQLQNDITCIEDFQYAVSNNMSSIDALQKYMNTASQAAIDYATSTDIASVSTKEFEAKQKASQISLMAQSQKFSDIKLLINEYNTRCQASGMAQTDFVTAIGQSNSNLATYLSGLNGAKASLSGYITSLVETKVASIGLQVATMALNMALSMGLAVAIQAIITGLNNLIHAQKNASESAHNAALEAKEESDKYNEEIKTLDKLIAKYNELARSDIQDVDTRNQIRDVQSQISDLVGSQADNIDLVNGKLDDQLNKLNKIREEESKNALDKATAAYHTAKKDSENAIAEGSFWFMDGIVYKGEREKDVEKILKDAGYGGNIQSAGFFGSSVAVTDNFDNEMNKLENAAEKAEYLRGMVEEIKANYQDYASSDLYNGLLKQIEAYDKYTDAENKTAKNLLQSTTNLSTFDNELKKISVNSLETYEQYRQKLIDLVSESPDLKEAFSSGNLDNDDVETFIDSYLSTLTEFSDYYDDWKEKIQQSTEDVFKVSEEQKQKVIDSFKDNSITDWFNSLSEDEKNLIYRIGVESDDTALWTLDKWEEELQYLEENNETASESMQKFYNIMNNTGDGSFVKEIESRTEKLDTLKEALEKFQSGDLSDSDIVELMKEFPELIEYSDDLGTGISEAMNNIIGDSKDATSIIGLFDAQIEKLGKNSAGAKAIKKLRDEIIKLYTAISNTSISNLEKQINDIEDKISINEKDTSLIKARQNTKKAEGFSLSEGDYQDLISQSQNLQQLYGEQIAATNSLIQENLANGTWTSDSNEYKEAVQKIKDYQVKLQECVTEQKELNNSIASIPYDKAEEALDKLEAINDNYDSLVEIRKVKGFMQTASEYQQQIANIQTLISQYTIERDQAWNDYQNALANGGAYGGKSADEWLATYYKFDTQINKATADIEKLNNAIINLPYEEMERALSLVEAMSDNYDSLVEISKVKGFVQSAHDYQQQIYNLQNMISQYASMRDQAWGDYQNALANGGAYGGKSVEEWLTLYYQFDTQINKTTADIEKLNNAIINLPYDEAERMLNQLQAISENYNSLLEINSVKGFVQTAGEYQQQIANLQSLISQYQVQKSLAWSDFNNALANGGAYGGKSADEWLTMYYQFDTQINKTTADVERLYNAIVNLPYEEIERVVDKLNSIYEEKDARLKLLTTSGYTLTKYDYANQIPILEQKISQYEQESMQALGDYYNALANGGAYGGKSADEWITLYHQLGTEIYNTKIQLQELNNAIVQSPFDQWDKYIKWVKGYQEYDNTLTELKNVKGYFTDASDYKDQISTLEYLQFWNKLKWEEARRNLDLAYRNNGVYGGKDTFAWKDEISQYATEIENLQIEIEKAKNNMAQLPYDRMERELDKLKAIADLEKSIIDLKSAKGLDLSEGDYTQQIKNNDKQINELEKKRDQALSDYRKAYDSGGVYGGKSYEEWMNLYRQLDTEVNNLLIENEKLKDSLRDDVYWRTFDKAHESCQRVAKVLSGISNLMDDDMYFDKDGNLTKYGVVQIANLVKEFENARKEVKNYSKDINNLNILYKQGLYTTDEYNDKLNELQSSLLSSASNMKSVLSEIKDMYKEMAQSELDDLFDLIDARNDALSAKKEYYDYDKTIKSKTKDIQSLQAQIAALEGVENAEAKAQRAVLDAKLVDSQQDLDDTINEHLIKLSQDTLDGLKETLQESFDDKWDNISSNLEEIAKLMTSANMLTTASASTINDTLNQLLKYYGINPVSTGITNITGYASGTKRVNKNKIAWTQEDGKEMIIRPSDGAILTPVKRGDIIPNADLSNNLFKWGELNPQEFANNLISRISSVSIPTQTPSISISQNYGSLLNVEGNVDSTVVSDIKKFVQQFYEGAYDYIVKEIVRDARKIGIKV